MQQFLKYITWRLCTAQRFGHPHAHQQELNNCSSSLWFFRWKRGDSSAVGRSRAGRPDHDQQHCYHHIPVVVAPDDGHEDARNMLSCT